MNVIRRVWPVCLVLLAASTTAAHEDHRMDPHHPTPGLRLEMRELPRTSPSASVTYRLHAVGFPRGVSLNVWAQDFGHDFRLAASKVEVDDSGKLVSSNHVGSGLGHQATQIVFGPGPYPRGAAWRVALVSQDYALKAFAAAIPYPITGRDGPCTVSLEVVSYGGDHFVATGTGFAPGDEVVTEARYSGRTIQKRQRISSGGLLPLSVISHQAIGTDRSARYLAKGRLCEVAVEYTWGEAALLRR